LRREGCSLSPSKERKGEGTLRYIGGRKKKGWKKKKKKRKKDGRRGSDNVRKRKENGRPILCRKERAETGGVAGEVCDCGKRKGGKGAFKCIKEKKFGKTALEKGGTFKKRMRESFPFSPA